MIDPLALAFANTRSSTGRDRIATVAQFRTWARPWLASTTFPIGIQAGALPEIRAQRDATQLVLHHIAEHTAPSEEDLERATRSGLAAAAFRLRPSPGGVAVDRIPPDGVPNLISRSLVDFLVSPRVAELRRCQGAGCHKVFLAHRADRRWCDSRVCGNRARVAAHAHRQG